MCVYTFFLDCSCYVIYDSFCVSVSTHQSAGSVVPHGSSFTAWMLMCSYIQQHQHRVTFQQVCEPCVPGAVLKLCLCQIPEKPVLFAILLCLGGRDY